MKNLYLKYFAGVRWVELIMAVAISVLSDIQTEIALSGGAITQPVLLKALANGGKVAWAYLRMPKVESPTQPSGEPVEGSWGSTGAIGELPPGVDASGPHHDVAAEIVTQVISDKLGPIAAAAPELAKNITDELGRVLHRGIKF